MEKDQILVEARRLHALDFAIHWLRPKSKVPVEPGWTTGPRKDWDYLAKTYRPGFNLGVRLGSASKIAKGFLAVIDVDVKSKDERHRREAIAAAKSLLGDNICPMVRSGRGGGSRHYYYLSERPFKTYNPVRSTETVKVHTPSKKPSKAEIAELTEKEIADGWRLSIAWEVSLYSEGRQVVLPPSIHPDTGTTYTWGRNLEKVSELPLLGLGTESNTTERLVGEQTSPKKEGVPEVRLEGFAIEPVELGWLPISDEVRLAIQEGRGVTDSSASLLRACTALSSAGLTRNQILTILTDKENFLGGCAYEHTGGGDRNRAAAWVYRYTLSNVEAERSGDKVFVAPPTAPRELMKEERDAQDAEFQEGRDWRQDLVKTAKGIGYKPCFMNALLILENEFNSSIFHKDDFSLRRTYGTDTPWGGKKDRELSDEDVTAIRRYIGEKYGFELEEKHVVSAITSISSRNHHHPVREYLDNLVWDGTPRVDTWLKVYAGVRGPSEYIDAISRKVLCAMVERAYRPGAKFDYVLILEGPNQGEGKSRSIRALAGPDWAGTVRFDMDHKDFVLALQGRWITEISELSGLGKKNTAFVKAIVSEESDRIRHPYGRFTETLPRQGVFIGTTNHFQYLEDETGNRRFWPVRVGSKIDVEGITKIRDQLFAEAKVMVEAGEPLYLENPEVEQLARRVQRSRMSEDSWEEKITKFAVQDAEKPEKERLISGVYFKVVDLFSAGGPLHGSLDSEINLRRACRALRRLDFYPKDVKHSRGHGKYWTKD